MALGIGGPSDVVRANHERFAEILASVVDDCPDADDADAQIDLSGLAGAATARPCYRPRQRVAD